MYCHHPPKSIEAARRNLFALLDLFAVFPTSTVSHWVVHALTDLHRAEREHGDLPDDEMLVCPLPHSNHGR